MRVPQGSLWAGEVHTPEGAPAARSAAHGLRAGPRPPMAAPPGRGGRGQPRRAALQARGTAADSTHAVPNQLLPAHLPPYCRLWCMKVGRGSQGRGWALQQRGQPPHPPRIPPRAAATARPHAAAVGPTDCAISGCQWGRHPCVTLHLHSTQLAPGCLGAQPGQPLSTAVLRRYLGPPAHPPQPQRAPTPLRHSAAAQPRTRRPRNPKSRRPPPPAPPPNRRCAPRAPLPPCPRRRSSPAPSALCMTGPSARLPTPARRRCGATRACTTTPASPAQT